MKRHRLIRLSATLSALSALAFAAPGVAQSKPPSDTIERSDRARSLFKQGLDALASRKYEVARTQLLEAFKLSPSYDVAGALGQAELELNRYRDAAEHLELSLRTFPPSESLQLRKRVSDGLAMAKKRVAALRLTVAPEGVEVRVDGVPIGTAPLAPLVFVEPGSHELEARLPTGETDAVTLSALAGSEQGVSLAPHRKEPVPAAATPAAAPPRPTPMLPAANARPAAPDEKDHTRAILMITGGSIAVAGLATAIGFGVAANSAKGDAEKYKANLGLTGCTRDAPPADCGRLRDAVESQQSAAHIRNAGWIIAGVGAAAVGVALFLPESKDASRAGGTKHLALRWSGSGIDLSGSF